MTETTPIAPQELKTQPSEIPGRDKTAKKRMLELGADALQNFGPVNSINMHLCGFAFYNGQPDRQVELHHYCHNLNDEVTQCTVYDGDTSDARLVGVEYVISERLFKTLSAEEQKYWHNHQYDILSGSFMVPGVPSMVERRVLPELVNTYGKTWVTWQTDRGDVLPLGPPQLMMVANGPGQWNPELFNHRAKRLGHSLEDLLKNRQDLEAHPIGENADSWKNGEILQCDVRDMSKTGSSSDRKSKPEIV